MKTSVITIAITPVYHHSLYTQVMVIWILMVAQYLHNAVFGFEKGSNGENHSLSDSRSPTKKSPQQNFQSPLLG